MEAEKYYERNINEFLEYEFTNSRLLTCQITNHNEVLVNVENDTGCRPIYMPTLIQAWEELGRNFIIQNVRRFALKFNFLENPQIKGCSWNQNLRISYRNAGVNAIVEEFVKIARINQFGLYLRIRLKCGNIISLGI